MVTLSRSDAEVALEAVIARVTWYVRRAAGGTEIPPPLLRVFRHLCESLGRDPYEVLVDIARR